MYDLILKNGTVVDGTRAKACRADVCVKDGRIAAIVSDAGTDAERVLDVTGKIVCPGFIDMHSHSDTVPLRGGLRDSKLQQGITMELLGNCGNSSLPATDESLPALNAFLGVKGNGPMLARKSITDYAADINAEGYLNNLGMLVGHSALRLAATGFENRRPTEEEMQLQEELLARELERGCFGMSLGLIYPPSAFSEREELLRLAKVVAKHDGIVSVHMRNEGPKIFESVEEMLSIAEESGAHLEISHLKLMGRPQWGRAAELLGVIEAAQSRGVRVTCDQYPFLASSTSLKAVLPHWAQDGGHDAMMARLQSPSAELFKGIAANVDERGGPETILIVSADGCPQYGGRYVSDIMQELGLSAVDTVCRVLREADARVSCIYFCIHEQDLVKIMPKLYVHVGTDGRGLSYDRALEPGNPHPRNFGTFPQYFQTVREHGLLPVEDAVYKCTGLAAKTLGLTDRGILKEGLAADITVFDWDAIRSNCAYTDSRVKPDGIEYVIVGGRVALEHRNVTELHAGRVLLKGKA